MYRMPYHSLRQNSTPIQKIKWKYYNIFPQSGQEVHVSDGPFAGFNGVVSEVDNVKQKMTVKILVFGRETSIDLEFEQVERV